MSVSTNVWDEAWESLRQRFDDLGERLQALNASLTWSAGRHSNAAFPFRAYASFSRAGLRDQEDVVLSVDAAHAGQLVRIGADIAAGDGMMLADWPAQEIAVTRENVQREFAEIERFFADEFLLLRRHLVDPPFPGA